MNGNADVMDTVAQAIPPAGEAARTGSRVFRNLIAPARAGYALGHAGLVIGELRDAGTGSGSGLH